MAANRALPPIRRVMASRARYRPTRKAQVAPKVAAARAELAEALAKLTSLAGSPQPFTEVTAPLLTRLPIVRAGPPASLAVAAAELLALGWDELLEQNGVILAEWGDRFPELFPPDTIWLQFKVEEDGGRTLKESDL